MKNTRRAVGQMTGENQLADTWKLNIYIYLSLSI